MFARHDIAKFVGTAVAVAALGVTTPGSAAADATEDAFLGTVAAHGLGLGGSRALTVEKAQQVCAAFSGGLSSARVHEIMLDGSSSEWTPRQTELFMADAVQAYCPRYADLVIS